MIPYSCQSISREDTEAVLRVLSSEFLTQGPAIPAFEQAVSQYCSVKNAVAVSSATAALHLACLAFDLGPGDWLWTSPITFVASANCALYCGAQVDFVDVDPRTYNLDVEALKRKLVEAEKNGCLPKVVVPVHFGGQSCAMKEIFALSQVYGFRVIEDASHSLGADYLGKKVGSCEYSDASVFSFHAVKMITTGEGGMVVTNDDQLAARISLLRTHGITRSPALLKAEAPDPWYYEQQELGFHYRMTDLQAALGTSQLGNLEEFVAQRRAIAARYDDLLGDSGFTLPWQDPAALSSWHLYVVLCEDEAARRACFHEMRQAGIGVNVHYIPVYWQPCYEALGFKRGLCPIAEDYYRRTLSLPVHCRLSHEEIHFVAEQLISAGKQSIAKIEL